MTHALIASTAKESYQVCSVSKDGEVYDFKAPLDFSETEIFALLDSIIATAEAIATEQQAIKDEVEANTDGN